MDKSAHGTSNEHPVYPMAVRHIGRRDFLHKGALGLFGAGLATWVKGLPASAQETKKSRLAFIKHANATDERGTGEPEIVRQMIDRAVRELTGKDSLADAWREFVSPDDIVGIKVNLRGGKYLAVQPCVVDAIVAGLTAAGVKPNNIIVWDMWTREFPLAGYTLNDSGEGVRYYATDRGSAARGSEAGIHGVTESLKPFHAGEPVQVADKAVYFSKILAEEVTALINVPMIKDHSITGITCAMKNHCGSIMNPRDLHGDCCDPYLAELNAAAPIKGKTRLVIVDGLRSLYNGGPHDKPKWRWRQNSIIAGTDPVAVDALALRIINEKRQEEDMAPVTRRAKHIATAARIGLGTNDLSQVDLREIDTAREA